MSEARAPAGAVEVLGPEKRTRVRRDGWTRRRRQLFLEAVAQQATMQEAARGVGMSMQSVRNLRARDPEFDRDCAAALASVRPSLVEAAYQRAVIGVEEPVFQGGKLVGHRRRYSDSVLRLMLERGLDPANGTPGMASRPAKLWARPSQAEIDAELKARLDALSARLKKGERQEQLAWTEKMEREGWAP